MLRAWPIYPLKSFPSLEKRRESWRKRPNSERVRNGKFIYDTKANPRNEKARDLVKSETIDIDTLKELSKRISS
jgi:hypothetical protein